MRIYLPFTYSFKQWRSKITIISLGGYVLMF